MNCELINPDNNADSLIEKIFINRGFKKEDIFHYLNTTEEDLLSPELLSNIQAGAIMLEDCIRNFKKVFIIPDVDADGFTSAAILINYLSIVAPLWVRDYVTYEINEGKVHGIVMENIPEDVSLVICPDSASSDYEQHKKLKEKGINVLVLDHHEANSISPDACVINNQLCDYPNKSLSGAGVVYKFCCYLDKIWNINEADNFRDLAALGMISDMVSLKDFETRHLIKTGLSSLRNPYFKAMCKKNEYSLGEEITPIGIAFYITPYINATIRMGSKSEKQTLFEAMLDLKAYEEIPSTKRGCKGQVETRVEQACRNCTNIKNRQTRARDASLERVEELISKNKLLDNKILTVLLPKEINFETTLTGLIANQLMAKYQKPVLLLRQGETEDKQIIWEGSARGLSQSLFDDFKGYITKTNLFSLAQGHANAFGSAILDNYIEEFISLSNKELEKFDFNPCYKVDCIFEGKDFSTDDILSIGNLSSIWGQGVEEPYVLIKNLSVTKDKITLMKGNTLKIQLDNDCSLIRFKSSEEEYKSLYSDLGCVRINVVGRCDKNVWNGRTTAQIKVVDIEIVSEQPYYF